MGLFRSPRSRQGGSGAQEGRFRSPNRPDHQSREQMGLFRSPRSRQGGSGAQEGPVPLTKSNRCGHGRSAVGSGLLAAGCWQRAARNGQRAAGNEQQAARNEQRERAASSGERAAGSGERAAGSGERTGRRNRLRKGSATKELIIQHLNVDKCLQIRIILTNIAKIADGKTEGKSWLTSIISDFPQHDTN